MSPPRWNEDAYRTALLVCRGFALLFLAWTFGLLVLVIASPFARGERFAFACFAGADVLAFAAVSHLITRIGDPRMRMRRPWRTRR